MDLITPVKDKVSVSRGPGRQLRIGAKMKHSSGNSITNLRFVPRISVGGVLIHDGPAGAWSPVGHAVLVEPHGPLELEIAVPLTQEHLEAIESARVGDIDIAIQGIVEYSIAHAKPNEGHWLAGETRRMALAAEGGGSWTIKVPLSEWVKLLNELDWGLRELVEVSCGPSVRGPAAGHLERARLHFLQGHWDEVLGSSYRALEACVPKAESQVGRHVPELSGDAAEALNMICMKAKRFMHAGRHEEGSQPGRREAQFALLLAAGIASLMSTPAPFPPTSAGES